MSFSAGSPQGFQTPESIGDDYNAHAFLIQSLLNRAATATLVQVKAVTNAGGIAPVGYVDVQPMVAQVDGVGNAVPHGGVHNLPYFRIQGGASAIILDPQVGDIGVAVFCDHDISAVKASKAPATPGSWRRFDMADGVYIGGVLNGTPTQYIAFTSSGISIAAPTVAIIGDLTVTGGVTAGFGGADSVTLQHHKHPANNTPPTAGT